MSTPRLAALIVTLGAAAVLAAGCKTSTGGTSSTGSTPGAATTSKAPAHSEDVTISNCGNDDAGFAAAKVVVTNHSSKTSNYAITIAFESPDGATQIGTGLVAVENLAAGQASAPQDASSLQTPTGVYTCKVADVTRYAAA
jgi:transcription elongation factor